MSTKSQERLGIRIGRLVREARTRQKMKLTDLAEMVGRTAAQISTLERGIYQWTDSVLEGCANALDIPLAQAFAEEDEVVLKLPNDPEAIEQARKLAVRLRHANADEIKGMLVWSQFFRANGHDAIKGQSASVDADELTTDEIHTPGHHALPAAMS